jgi:cell division protein FtsQ
VGPKRAGTPQRAPGARPARAAEPGRTAGQRLSASETAALAKRRREAKRARRRGTPPTGVTAGRPRPASAAGSATKPGSQLAAPGGKAATAPGRPTSATLTRPERKARKKAEKRQAKALAARRRAQALASGGPAATAARFEAKAKADRRARRWRVARHGLYVLVPVALAAVVWFTPVCAVRQGEIEVRGIGGVVSQATIDQRLRTAVGTPLAQLNTGALAKRLDSVAGVKSATVRRVWPTGLRVTIDPRIPAACVQSGGAWVLLDGDAVELGTVATPPAGLPQVDVPLRAGNARTLRSVLDALAGMPAWLTGEIAHIGATTQDTVHFTLTSGAQVAWGDGSAPALKAAALKVLLGQAGKSAAASAFDVSAPTLPYIRPPSQSPSASGTASGTASPRPSATD